MGRDKRKDKLEPCEYFLKPEASNLESATLDAIEVDTRDDHSLIDHLNFKHNELLEPCSESDDDTDTYRDEELGWKCRRLTIPQDDGPTLCPFHQDPADREVDDAVLSRVFLSLIRDERGESQLFQEYAERYVGEEGGKAEAFLSVDPPEGTSEHAESVARRRKMFCGAQFERLLLPDRVFRTPNRYPIDLRLATVAELNFKRALIEAPVKAHGIHTPPGVAGKITFKHAVIDGELSLIGLATDGKVSLSEADLADDVLFRDALIGNEISIRDTTVDGQIKLIRTEVDETVRFVRTDITGKLSLSYLTAGKVRLDHFSTGANVSLHHASINTNLCVKDTSIGEQFSLHDGVVRGEVSFNETQINGDIDLNDAKLSRSWGSVSFRSTVINGDIKQEPKKSLIVGGSISFENATIDGNILLKEGLSVDGVFAFKSGSVMTCELLRAEVHGPIDLRGISAERLHVEPPSSANRHPVINAVLLGNCQLGTAALAPSYSGEMEDTVVYDIEAGTVNALEEIPGTVPEHTSLYDYLRLVETDFTEIDFSIHRDRLFRNNWNLHGLRDGGERDVQLARGAATTDFLTHPPDHINDTIDEEVLAARAREQVESWLEGTEGTADDNLWAIPPVENPDRSSVSQVSAASVGVSQLGHATQGPRGIDVGAEIEKSWLLSRLDITYQVIHRMRAWLANVPVPIPIRQSIDRGPPTITLDQLESTYAGAKAAADANGDNGVASTFFIREQRYIQLQNRSHIREELVVAYLSLVGALRLKAASVTNIIKATVTQAWGASSEPNSALEGPADETDSEPESDERNDISEDGSTSTNEAGNSSQTSMATFFNSPIPSSNFRTLWRYLLAWISNGSLRVFTTYGESPRRVLGWWGGIIFMWTGLYYVVTVARLGVEDAWEILVDQGSGFFLLSIGSFTTVIPPIPILPFGDSAVQRYAFLEDDPIITLLSGLEGLLGILFVSLFVLTLTRSIQR